MALAEEHKSRLFSLSGMFGGGTPSPADAGKKVGYGAVQDTPARPPDRPAQMFQACLKFLKMSTVVGSSSVAHVVLLTYCSVGLG